MLNKLKSYLTKRKQGKSTARPTTIKLGEGTVILRNLPKEKVEEIKKFLLETPSSSEAVQEEPELEMTLDIQNIDAWTNDNRNYNLPMDQKAFGIYKNSAGSWLVVELQYNSSTKQATVTNVIDYKSEKNIAMDEFRVKVAKTLLW